MCVCVCVHVAPGSAVDTCVAEPVDALQSTRVPACECDGPRSHRMTHALVCVCVPVPAGGRFGYHGGFVGGLAVYDDVMRKKKSERSNKSMMSRKRTLEENSAVMDG